MMAVPVTRSADSKASFEAGAPHALFDTRLSVSASNAAFEYDVTADGKRFLIANPTTGTGPVPPLTVVVNWDAAVKK
jgi:hypothetical protein